MIRLPVELPVGPAPPPPPLADELLELFVADARVVPVPDTVSPTSPESETIVPPLGA